LFSLQGQTILTGKVVDTKNQPIVGANISIKGSYDGGSSDKDGNYSFKTSRKDSQVISASYSGFTKIEKAVFINQNTMQLNFTLKEKLSQLKAVIISAGSFEASDEKKSTVLKPLDIVTTAGSNGDSYGALKTLPGTQQTNDRDGLFVRGGTGAETQTFIDGTLVRNAFTASVPDLGSRGRFNPFIFKGTVFSSGGYSALYGQALSSVVLLETTDLPDKSSGSTSLSTVGLGASMQKLSKDKNKSFGLGYNYVNLTPYFLLLKQTVDYVKAPTVHQIDANFRVKTSKYGMLKFYGYFNNSNIHIKRNNITSQDYSDINKHYKDDYAIKNNNIYANLSYKEYIKKDLKLLAGLSVSYNKDLINIGIKDKANNYINDSNFFHQENQNIKNNNIVAQGKVVLEKTFNNIHTLRFGAEHIYGNDDFIFSTPYIDATDIKIKDNFTAAFAEGDIYITNDIAGKIGIRGEHSSIIDKYNIAPRISAAYKLNRRGQISGAYGIFYQKPENQFLFQTTNLNFQRADHFLINYIYQPKERFLRTEFFYKKYYNLIKTNTAKPENSGNGYASGAELFFRDRKTFKGIDYWISYSYINTKRNFLNYPGLRQPDFVANHVASLVWKKFWVKKNFGINGTYTFTTGRPYVNKNETDPAKYLSDRTENYHTIALSLNYLKTYKNIFNVFVISVTNPLGFKQIFGYNFANKDLNNDGLYFKNAIVPSARQFVFIGLFSSWGIDRTKEAIDNNL
jgi:hypothetical protein